MICDKCKKEIENDYVTKKFGSLEITRVIQRGKCFKDLVIPKGFSLLSLSEAVTLVNNPDFLKWSSFNDEKHDFFIEQPFVKNKNYVSWLGCGNDYFYILTDSDLDNYAARGVVLKKVKP